MTAIGSFLAHLRSSDAIRSKTFLILGKGPTSAKLGDPELSKQLADSAIVSLNHAVRICRPHYAHFVDLDAFLECHEAADKNAGFVVLPWQPHIENRPTPSNLQDLALRHTPLASLAAKGRLLTYNLSSGSNPRPGEPNIRVRNFSAEAALNLLAFAGVARVRTLGVDGGSSYSTQFKLMSPHTLLANGQNSFDVQFKEFARSAFENRLDFGPLDRQVPVRIFVGSAPEQELACKVLEFSIRRRSSLSVEVTPLYAVAPPHPTPRDPANRPRTPFSFQRFQIPELCGFKGRAIYVDSDMQVFRDIRELWFSEMHEAHVLATKDRFGQNRKPQFSVMLIDCERAQWRIDELVGQLDSGKLDYAGLMERLGGTPFSRRLHRGWNCLEYFSPRHTRLLHYTDMPTQPWISLEHPLESLWVNELIDGIALQHIPLQMVKDSVARGWVRPSLWEQVLGGRSSPVARKELRRIDEHYTPPWESLETKGFAGKTRKKYSVSALIRSIRG